MGFRDQWMRVGKAGKSITAELIEPIHLVLIEEPEAHLHAQIQQVFIRKAYNVLRAHPDLGDKGGLRTQLIVSTHSSHVAHQIPFSCLRYFRRLPAGMAAAVPVSAVVNLRTVFGGDHETERFVTRYLRSYHADLLFADAAILVEGPAEYIIIPNLIRKKYEFLNQCYITILEIGGSHAHRLRPLIEHLGLSTLIITDLDAGLKGAAVPTKKGSEQTTNNSTLTSWLPKITKIDELLAATEASKVEEKDPIFAVRVAYQTAISMNGKEALPTTFEDALAFENVAFFKELEGTGLVAKFRSAAESADDPGKMGAEMFEALKTGKKAELALDIIGAKNFDEIIVPRYIVEGLEWLTERLKKKQTEVVTAAKKEDVLNG
jgi:predicted ATP-dependent endonuclease of OLD family